MLGIPRELAQDLLADCLERGQGLIERASLVGDISDFESWRAERQQWTVRCTDALARMLENPATASEFRRVATAVVTGPRWQADYAKELESLRRAVAVLLSLQAEIGPSSQVPERPERLTVSAVEQPSDSPRQIPPDLPPQVTTDLPRQIPSNLSPRIAREQPAQPQPHVRVVEVPPPEAGRPQAREVSQQVLLLHGQNHKLKRTVLDLLERAGPHEIVAIGDGSGEEQALTEWIASTRAQPGYAVVVLSADEVGTLRLDPDESPFFSLRASPSVVFKLGVLVGALAPGRLCVLYERGLELPGELAGALHIQLDLDGSWRPTLLNRLRDAGLQYDPALAQAS